MKKVRTTDTPKNPRDPDRHRLQHDDDARAPRYKVGRDGHSKQKDKKTDDDAHRRIDPWPYALASPQGDSHCNAGKKEKKRSHRGHHKSIDSRSEIFAWYFLFETICNIYYNLVMLKIVDAVEQIVRSSEMPYLSLKVGVLNLSAYAKKIQKDVERLTKKPVRLGSIVVALSRLRPIVSAERELIPNVALNDIAVRSGLVEIVFERTAKNLRSLDRFAASVRDPSEILMITRGVGEITLIAPQRLYRDILRAFHSAKPKALLTDLAGVTVRFDERYIDIPNTFYSILQTFAMHTPNIIEMVSTYTEINFIFKQEDVQRSFAILSSLLTPQHTSHPHPDNHLHMHR